MKSAQCLICTVLLLGSSGCAATIESPVSNGARGGPEAGVAASDSPSMLEQFQQVAKLLGVTGTERTDSYFISIPRDDLIDVTSEIGDVPVSAGLDTQLHLFKCPCGRLSAIGQFVVVDFEMNDVMDALRKDLVFKIVSTAPILLNDRPRIMIVRFQGEGTPEQIAATIREALRWVGPERNKKQPPMFP